MKTKLFVFLLFLLLNFPYSFSIVKEFNQIEIPLDNENGISFSRDDADNYYVEGFDIDDDGHLYFFSGEPAVLSCFINDKIKFRKEYNLLPGSIYLQNKMIYSYHNRYDFDKKEYNKCIVELDKKNGEVISLCNEIESNEIINSFVLNHNGIIILVNKNQRKSEPSFKYYLYSYKGKFLKEVESINTLPPVLDIQGSYIGKWNKDFIFYTYDDEFSYITFIRIDNDGNKFYSNKIKDSVLGKGFYSDIHIKIRNNNLYILRHKNTNAIISYISLDELFHE